MGTAFRTARMVFPLLGLTMLFPLCALAQSVMLNQNCVVSVLNRTVPVNPDGTWVLPNIPANFGPVRARATCVSNGVTQFGQSAFFSISANGASNVPPIALGSVTPIPTSIAIMSPSSTLTSAGQSTQLTVTASYTMGSPQDVTAASMGTIYNISNSAIATVSAGGLVTAVSSGTAVLQAVNEGRQSIISIAVVLGSSHGGIPDSWALAHGLDPNDPAMPFEDPDHDGLTNLQEFQNGTDPHSPDTDGDGLTDGQEVLMYGTNPALFSTDGTGISDGIEIQTGTLGGTLTAKLAAAIRTLEVKPSNFVLAVNTIQGLAAQQLSVLGHLIDGKTTLDLTSTTEGTTYASSDLTICNFGTPDGNVFAGNNGTCTITVTNSGFSVQATGTVSTFTPTALSFLAIPGFANGVDVNGNYAYVAAGAAGLQVVNVSDRANPTIAGSLPLAGNTNDVRLLGNFAYIAGGSAGLQVVDITNPAVPVLRGTLPTSGNALDVAVRGTTAYIANGSNLFIADVTNPAVMSRLGTLALSGTIQGVDVDTTRNLAVVAAGNAGIYVVDISNPSAPVLLGTTTTGDARDVAIQGNYAFVADYLNSTVSVDITSPSAPTAVSHIADPNLGGFLQDITLSGTFALGADVKFFNGIPITDISTPTNLLPRAILNFTQRDDNGMGIAADGAYAYLTTEHSTLNKFGTAGDSRLYIGQYLALVDNKGIPPTAAITSPASGGTVVEGQRLPITVNATDDVAVAAVNFLVNGQVVFTATSKPYQFNFTVPHVPGSLTIGATAVDLGGNVGTAPNVTLNVIPDPGTTVVCTVVDLNQNPVPGATVTLLGGTLTTTASDGTFSIPGAPTILGGLFVTASGTVNGVLLGGASAVVAPVSGGVTNVGTIVLSQLGSHGRDFWLAFESALENPTAEIFIVTDGMANYSVTNSSTGFNVTGAVTSQSPVTIAVPSTLQIQSNETVENLGVHVTADADVSVFFFYPDSVTADTYLAIPTPSLGTEYFALGYTDNIGYPSELAVIASQDGTNVTISNPCGAGTPLTATLNQGQTYQLQCSSDVSGAHVVSNYPVAVTAGSSCSDIPAGAGACDVVSEMMFPVGRLWGTEVYSAPLPGGGYDVYRVMAARDGTTVTVDQGGGNVQTFALNAGQFQEIQFKAGAHFTSNQPMLVIEYMTGVGITGVGDPFSMQLVPVTSFAQSFRFYAPPNQGWTNQAIIIAPNNAVASVQLNGIAVSGFLPLPGGAYQYAVVSVPDGQNFATASQPITVYSIGYQYAGSYGSPTRF
jgi:hypothetical protein